MLASHTVRARIFSARIQVECISIQIVSPYNEEQQDVITQNILTKSMYSPSSRRHRRETRGSEGGREQKGGENE
jgi:hypothetical protein